MDHLTPERIVDGHQQLSAIERLVAADEDVQLLLEAWKDGLRGQQAASEVGFDMKRYDAARKRLVRLLDSAGSVRGTK